MNDKHVSGQSAAIQQMMRNWRSRRGLASALIIMILVLLVFLSVLALVASAADLRLARKRADWNQQFYQADTTAITLYAELDQYCHNLARSRPDPDRLAEALVSWLGDQPDARDSSLVREGNNLRLDMLALGQTGGTDARQGIRMTLVLNMADLQEGKADDALAILRWTQWQTPFDYDADHGGIWEG